MSDIRVSLNEAKSRYEALLDGQLAGFAEYRRGTECIAFTHTEVKPAYEGQGVAGAIAQYSLDDVRAKGTHRVIAQCSYYHSWIDKHPEYADLLADLD